MNKNYYKLAAFVFVIMFLNTLAVLTAKPYNIPTLDGSTSDLTAAGTNYGEGKWELSDYITNDPANYTPATNKYTDLKTLRVTWSESNLYISVIGTNENPDGNYGYSLIVYLDTDASKSTGTTNFWSENTTVRSQIKESGYGIRLTSTPIGVDWRVTAWGHYIDFRKCNYATASNETKYSMELTNANSIYMDNSTGFRASRSLIYSGTAGYRIYEFSIPFKTIYSSGIPNNCKIRFMVSVNEDWGSGTGADANRPYDLLPHSNKDGDTDGTPDENDSDANWWDYFSDTDLNYYEVTIDSDGDGIPDDNKPPVHKYSSGGFVDNLTATPFGGSGVKLNWDNSIFFEARDFNYNLTNYLYRSTSPINDGNKGSATKILAGVNKTNYTDATATSGVKYYYALTAVDEAGNESSIIANVVVTNVFGSVTSSTGSKVILDNFEDGNVNEWRIWNMTNSIDSANQYEGSSCMKLVDGNGSWAWRYFKSDSNWTNYTNAIFFYAKGSTGGESINLEITYTDDTKSTNTFTLTTSYVKYASGLKTGYKLSQLSKLAFFWSASSGKTVYIDDIYLQGTPDAPSSVSATIVNQSNVLLSWNASSDDKTGVSAYEIYRTNSSFSSTNQAVVIATTSQTKYTDVNVLLGSTYYYRVRAVDGAGNKSGLSSEVSINVVITPTAPQNLSGVYTNGMVNLDWNSSTGGPKIGYKIYRKTSAFTAVSNATLLGITTGTNYTDNSITEGTVYYYRVTATNGYSAESGASGIISITVPTSGGGGGGTEFSADIDSTGGEISDAGYPSTKITFPAGAVTEAGITIKLIRRTDISDAPLAYELIALKNGKQIELDIKIPITLQIYYPVDGNIVRNTTVLSTEADKYLSVKFYDGVKWQTVGGTVNKSSQTITFKAVHLGVYAIKEVKAKAETFTLTGAGPNPFTPNSDGKFDFVYFNFENPEAKDVKLSIYDVYGRLIEEKELGAVSTAKWAPPSDLKAGLYIYQLECGGKVESGVLSIAK